MARGIHDIDCISQSLAFSVNEHEGTEILGYLDSGRYSVTSVLEPVLIPIWLGAIGCYCSIHNVMLIFCFHFHEAQSQTNNKQTTL